MPAVLKKIGILVLVPVIVVLTPILHLVVVWMIAIGGIRQALIERSRKSRQAVAEAPVCSIDADCPPGHVCIRGRCVPDTG